MASGLFPQVPAKEKAQIGPFFGGFDSTRKRFLLDPSCLNSESTEWHVDPLDGRLVRRLGSAIFGDTITSGHETSGILETQTGTVRAYQAVDFRSDSLADSYPVPGLLFADEANNRGTFAWRDTNDNTWKQLGKDFTT